jgi:hypothetical protein
MITYPMILGTVGRKFESCRPDQIRLNKVIALGKPLQEAFLILQYS